MKLLIVSDSHGNSEVLSTLKDTYKNDVDALIHCGDSELQEEDPAIQDYIVVSGNCDWGSQFPNEKLVTIHNNKILISHGHLYRIHATFLPLAYRAKELGAEFVFFGHTHLPVAEMNDGILFVNPGSILLPRGGHHPTYSIVSKNDSITVQFFNKDHHELVGMRQVFK